jgi:hypothetical protein
MSLRKSYDGATGAANRRTIGGALPRLNGVGEGEISGFGFNRKNE